MFRTVPITAAAWALLCSAAFAQTSGPAPDASNGPPAQLSSSDQPSDGNGSPSPPGAAQAQNGPQDQRSRDLFCRRDAAARTGYVTPDQAARQAQANGSLGGAVGGAALGAIIGGASHAAGPGALIGAGAGLIAGTAIGSDNAHQAASNVERAYSDAYYACMDEADDRGPPPGPGYAYGPPPGPGYGYGSPPPAYYYGAYPYPYYYPPYYYGPGVSVGFGFGGYHGWRGGYGFRR